MLAISALGALAIALATRGIVKWYVMTDELSYLKQSVFIGRHLRLPMAGDPYFNSHSDLLPLLGAPFLALFPTMTALKLFHVVAAIAMASAAVPVFLLARRVTRSAPLAALAGALAIAVPWVGMSVSFMSEVVAYPVTAWALLAIHGACVRPGARSDALALLAIALACFARAQLVVLAPVLVACVVVHEMVCTPGRPRDRSCGTLRRHRVLAIATAIGMLGGILVLAVPSIATALLGNYDTTTTGGLIPSGMWVQTRFMLATHIVAVGVLPFVFGVAFALAALVDRRDRDVQAAATLILIGGLVLVLQAGWFTRRYASYDDRYLLYLAPLLIVGLVEALGRPWRLRFTALPVAAFGWYAIHGVAIVPSALYVNSISTVNYAAIQRWVGKVTDVSPTSALAFLAAVALALAVALGRLRRRWVVPVAIGVPFLVVMLLSTANIFKRLRLDWHATVAAQQTPLGTRDWVDDAVGGRAAVAALLGLRGRPGEAPALWWDTAYWNKSLSHAYTVLPGGEDLTHNYTTGLRIDSRDGRVENLSERYALLPKDFVGFDLRGALLVRERDGLRLLRLPTDPHVGWRLTGQGVYGDVPRTGAATLTLYASGRAATCRVTLHLGAVTGTMRRVALERSGAAGRGRSLVTPNAGVVVVRLRARVPARGSGRIALRSRPVGSGQDPAQAQLLGLAVRCPGT